MSADTYIWLNFDKSGAMEGFEKLKFPCIFNCSLPLLQTGDEILWTNWLHGSISSPYFLTTNALLHDGHGCELYSLSSILYGGVRINGGFCFMARIHTTLLSEVVIQGYVSLGPGVEKVYSEPWIRPPSWTGAVDHGGDWPNQYRWLTLFHITIWNLIATLAYTQELMWCLRRALMLSGIPLLPSSHQGEHCLNGETASCASRPRLLL